MTTSRNDSFNCHCEKARRAAEAISTAWTRRRPLGGGGAVIFLLPLYDDNPIRRPPVVTYALIGMCIGAFLWQLGQNADAVAFQFGMIPARLFGYRTLPPELAIIPAWATIFTSIFLHGGWLHLGGNMLFLWIFGNNVEDLLGRARFLALYLASGVAAALIQALAAPHSAVPMIGASGAIAGTLGAYLVLYPRGNIAVFVWILIFVRLVAVPAVILLGLWFLGQLLSALSTDPSEPGVAFWAHVGGFIVGMLLVPMFRRHGVVMLQPRRSNAFSTTSVRRRGHWD
jgi:membrane associated rhomboid family serine protease